MYNNLQEYISRLERAGELVRIKTPVSTGKQPEKVLEESYYATQFALLADKAMHENQILRLDDKYKVPYVPMKK